MIGEAIAYGAGTIVNAIATGRGGAFGVRLWTKAKVRLTNEAGLISGRILSDPTEKTVLIQKAVSRVLRAYKLDSAYGAYVETSSNIPIARGLKSSSTAANAIVLATIAALGKEPCDDVWAIGLGVDAAIEAGVTITGALDDACASYLGNVVLTDNTKREIIKQFQVKEELAVLFLVPQEKAYTKGVDVARLRRLSKLVDVVHRGARSGSYWDAMTLNGLIYSLALGSDPSPAFEALRNGAIGAGLSGTGPATASVVPPTSVDAVRECWQSFEGEVIETRINRTKARILRTSND